jgi:hypothetical protein
MTATYTYSPLKEGESIRVLTLLHNSDLLIHCQLHARKHKDELEYDALSYAWQGETPTTSINIISDNKIYQLPIIPNLEAALRQLRDPQEDRASGLMLSVLIKKMTRRRASKSQ